MLRRRRENGSVVAFSTALAMVLVVLGVGFVFLLMYMGGQKETKNAVDAGALNVGKMALDDISVPTVPLLPNSTFFDCTSDTDTTKDSYKGKVTLRNINRVWAKALMMGINAEAADKAGQAGSTQSNAQKAIQEAQDLSDQLAAKLNDASNLYGYFDRYSTSNSVRMLSPDVNAVSLKGSDWQTALMDRKPITKQDIESNIIVNPNSMPANYSINSNYTTGTTRNNAGLAGNWKFLKGYTDLQVAGKDVWQVPFQYDEKPRLVSQSVFDRAVAKANPIDWINPVPNAFSVAGKVVKPNAAGEQAKSWMMTNPHETFQMGSQQSFLKIHLDQMVTKWFFYPSGYPPVPFGPDQNYGYDGPQSQFGTPMPAGGLFCSSVIPGDVEDIGLDVFLRPLDQIIFGPPSLKGSGDLEADMTSRINQMITKSGKTYSTSDLHSLLMDPATIGYLATNKFNDFVIYSPDGENLTVEPNEIAEAKAFTWMPLCIGNDPDGDEKKIVDRDWMPGPIFFEPTPVPDPFCSPDFSFGWAYWCKDLNWKPGSGYNHCLGTVHVTRWTEVQSLGVCQPL